MLVEVERVGLLLLVDPRLEKMVLIQALEPEVMGKQHPGSGVGSTL